MDWSKLTDEQLAALHRIAKDPWKGARPFFRDPKAMILLREELIMRRNERAVDHGGVM